MTSVLDRPAPGPDLTVPYGTRPEQVIDLRLPPAQRQAVTAPLIVLVHGGFWRPAYDRRHLGPMASALAAAGHVVAVPEYRRAGMAEEGWTGPFNDIAAALDQVGGIAGPHGADTSRITWAGSSTEYISSVEGAKSRITGTDIVQMTKEAANCTRKAKKIFPLVCRWPQR